jgi:GDP-L-fucose synthase
MKCLLLGGTGFVGQHIVRQRSDWTWTVVGTDHADLTDSNQLHRLHGDYDTVINCAGFYGGIPFNFNHQQEILFRNTLIATNVCKLVSNINPKKFVNIGSGCIYPKSIQNNMLESCIGPVDFHPSIQYSALSKYWSLKMTEVLDVPWEYLILSNIYGPGEHLEFDRSHFVGSLSNKIKQADHVIDMIGTGEGIRDFIYITDVAEAICRYCELETATCSISNISTGTGVSVKAVTDMLIDICKKDIKIVWGDASDNGVLYKVLNNSKMFKDIGYTPTTSLEQGLQQTWSWIQSNE